ncbi:dihydroxyacetone kinase DhaKLM complex PTS-EIIA-like component DhaM [Actinomadura pelletieri DSM 43383]|uniref:Dihydroxyacetone kinase DhaKLM complex PTS-EIIA-like component DhaM n=1 Tax=Actinomadura pelletieri DSM 43383 TaxID=1120940 RepID=A0A495QRY1_9ACTN|nr:phosphoenolpyruvate--protein phosphotransferase [Actinomadura pelletieri]RKS76217.1 dihydroxyacetone kinase DhaKLM complex PTS-EIIA-like component DhaM [Actinomadura pelletieri DSM 43383]
MVGIVIIAHSRTLAEGAAEVARAMGVGKAVVEPAGGDPEGGLGTSLDLVESAVAAADDGDGVVLVADLGSSVLTAKMLIEDTGGENVLLADAPLVEGAVAAASMAATGADLAAVHAAAEAAFDHRKTR